MFDARACCRYGLQRISPLMSNVVAVQEGGKVEMRWTPEGMALPAERSTLQIEPMKLVVGRGDFVSKIVNLLGLKDRYSRDEQALVCLCIMLLCCPSSSSKGGCSFQEMTDLVVKVLTC